MKNIIKFDISFYFIIILSFLSGNFKDILLLYFIIIIHELGHLLFIKLFNKKIIEIKLYPFGGITKYNTLVNHKIYEELLISFGGILFQLLLFSIFYILFKFNLINNYTYTLFIKNNISLIIFNILPIIGLDGEKIIHLILELFIPYKRVNNIVIIISIITFIILIIISFNYKINSIFVSCFLGYKIYYFIINKKYLENKFCLERYIYDIPYTKIKYINGNLGGMYQEAYHFINHKKEYVYLKEKYIDNNTKLC